MAAGSLDAEFKLSTAPLAGGGRPLARALAVSIVLHLLLLVFWIGVERRDPARPPPELVAIPLELIAPPPVPTPAGLPSERVTQSETDYLLAQIVRNWLLDYRNPRFADVILRFWFVLEPDGRIPPPLGGDGPIDFAQMVVNYPELVRASQIDPRYRDMRTALETFIVAVRASLPLAPQPDAPRAAGQRSMLIEFKLGDLAR